VPPSREINGYFLVMSERRIHDDELHSAYVAFSC
jgi:hypothetical protein